MLSLYNLYMFYVLFLFRYSQQWLYEVTIKHKFGFVCYLAVLDTHTRSQIAYMYTFIINICVCVCLCILMFLYFYTRASCVKDDGYHSFYSLHISSIHIVQLNASVFSSINLNGPMESTLYVYTQKYTSIQCVFVYCAHLFNNH